LQRTAAAGPRRILAGWRVGCRSAWLERHHSHDQSHSQRSTEFTACGVV